MMGSLGTKTAERRAADAAFRDAKRQLTLDKKRVQIENLAARNKAKTEKIDTGNLVSALRAQTESQSLLTPIAAQAESDSIDTEARSKFVKALPWILGGVVVVGAVVFLRKRAKGRA